MLAAARRLFVARGYGATTIQAIADEADVAVQTVYAAFGNKPSILAALVDVAIAGDDADIVINAREWMRPVWDAETAEERVRGYAAAVRRIMVSAGDVFAVVAAAATADADVADLAQVAEERRRLGATSVLDSVLSVGELRSDLEVDEAIDVLSLLNSPSVYEHLVRRRGWSLDRYESWLVAAMERELLAPPS